MTEKALPETAQYPGDDAPVGIIGAGSFGLAMAEILAEHSEVLIYARRQEVVDAINEKRGEYASLSPQIRALCDLAALARHCMLIFPIIPSQVFRQVMRDISPYLRPYHVLIHGTKGLDTSLRPKDAPLSMASIHTMSQVIEQETVVRRIGCLSGPNLAGEIRAGQPAATLIASRFREVIKQGQRVLRSSRFLAYGHHDIMGAELTGVFKNIIALAAGILGGKGLGKNLWALLITRGLAEMIHLGKAMGADVRPFLGVAGIGDLVATASSDRSRNYQVGYRMAQGESLKEILDSMQEVAEGVRTLETAKAIMDELQVSQPIMEVLYRVFFRSLDIDRAIQLLMTYPYEVDVDYLE